MGKELEALRNGQTVEVDGVNYQMDPSKPTGYELVAGDLYFAQRNGFVVRTVRNMDATAVYPVDNGIPAYAYHKSECVGVIVI